jgi:hypothetical protein
MLLQLLLFLLDYANRRCTAAAAVARAGRLDMQKPPLHQLQLRSISVALLSLHLASAFGSSIPAREAFDMGVQLSQLIGLGHTIGPPGGVLLMRKLADVLPPPLVGWRVKVSTWFWYRRVFGAAVLCFEHHCSSCRDSDSGWPAAWILQAIAAVDGVGGAAVGMARGASYILC